MADCVFCRMKGDTEAMSFKKPYQKAGGKTVHRASRKQRYSATVGFLKPRRYVESKTDPPVGERRA